MYAQWLHKHCPADKRKEAQMSFSEKDFEKSNIIQIQNSILYHEYSTNFPTVTSPCFLIEMICT